MEIKDLALEQSDPVVEDPVEPDLTDPMRRFVRDCANGVLETSEDQERLDLAHEIIQNFENLPRDLRVWNDVLEAKTRVSKLIPGISDMPFLYRELKKTIGNLEWCPSHLDQDFGDIYEDILGPDGIYFLKQMTNYRQGPNMIMPRIILVQIFILIAWLNHKPLHITTFFFAFTLIVSLIYLYDWIKSQFFGTGDEIFLKDDTDSKKLINMLSSLRRRQGDSSDLQAQIDTFAEKINSELELDFLRRVAMSVRLNKDTGQLSVMEIARFGDLTMVHEAGGMSFGVPPDSVEAEVEELAVEEEVAR